MEEDAIAVVCDESQCLSGTGANGILNPYGVRFDCLHQPGEETNLCNEGYTGHTIVPEESSNAVDAFDENETLRRRRSKRQRLLGDSNSDNDDDDQAISYTCCPNDYRGPIGPRRCSDPKILPPNRSVWTSAKLCPDAILKHPRQMKRSRFYPDTYVCCDALLASDNDENDSNFVLDEDFSTSVVDDAIAPATRSSCCFENRCASQVKFHLNRGQIPGRKETVFDPAYSCWGAGDDIFPFLCDGGYEGVPVASEPPIYVDLVHYGERYLYYYTCCSPNFRDLTPDCQELPADGIPSPEVVVKRHCSETIPGNATRPGACDGQDPTLVHPIPRQTVVLDTDRIFPSYVCCDIPALEAEEEIYRKYFDLQQCHPCTVFSEEFNVCVIDNEYGQLWAMVCDNSTWSNIKMIESATQDDLVRFECCKANGNGNVTTVFTNDPLIQDHSFRTTVYTQIAFSAVALAFSLVLFLGLLYSLVFPPKQGHEQATGTAAAAVTATTTRCMTSRQQQQQQDNYRCYNLYLVLLAFPDIVLSIFILVLYGRYNFQLWDPSHGGYIVDSVLRAKRKPLDNATILACSTANTYLNAVVAYEVFQLLKHSKQRKKYAPPSVRYVMIKALVVYAIAILVFLLRYYLEDIIPMVLQTYLFFGLSTAIPMTYVGYVCSVIWYYKLLPFDNVKLRVLSLYFLKIILVFVLVWLPAMLLLSLSRRNDTLVENSYRPIFYSVALILTSLQPILSTSLALTKPDVREAVVHFLTLPARWVTASKIKSRLSCHKSTEVSSAEASS